MEKSRPPFLKMLLWSFLAVWEDSGWAKSWLVFSMLTTVFIIDTAALLAEARLRPSFMTAAFALVTMLLSVAFSRLHRRCNGGEAPWIIFVPWKRGDR